MKTIPWEEAFNFLSKFNVCFDNNYLAAIYVSGSGPQAYITLYKQGVGMQALTISKEDNTFVTVTDDDGSLILNGLSAGHRFQSVVMPLKKAPYIDYSIKSWSATETS